MYSKMFSNLAHELLSRGWQVSTFVDSTGEKKKGLWHTVKSPNKLLTYGEAFDLEMRKEDPNLYFSAF